MRRTRRLNYFGRIANHDPATLRMLLDTLGVQGYWLGLARADLDWLHDFDFDRPLPNDLRKWGDFTSAQPRQHLNMCTRALGSDAARGIAINPISRPRSVNALPWPPR
eukprot:4346439-Pyramimonas_sp.AAC.1